METAFTSAVRTGRRRVWTLVRRSAAEGFWRLCPACHKMVNFADTGADQRVMELCADLACALLVQDILDPDTVASLTAPLHTLIPLQDRHNGNQRQTGRHLPPR
jgi:acetyl-CoA carboxylase beta subunit